MNRRGFLKGLVGVVAGAALAEELSTKSIFLPPQGGWPRKRTYGGLLSENLVQISDVRLLRSPEEVAEFLGPIAGVPQFLTNWMDPEIVNVLVSPEKYDIIRKLT
jgi:hypothetical protein